MKRDRARCSEWNQQRVEEAKRLIESRSHPALLPLDGVAYRGESQRDMRSKACRNVGGEHSEVGCTRGAIVIVNADRDVPNIAATIQHELEHIYDAQDGHDQGTDRAEGCADRREVQAGRVLGATPDRYSATSYNPSYSCSLEP